MGEKQRQRRSLKTLARCQRVVDHEGQTGDARIREDFRASNWTPLAVEVQVLDFVL